MWRGSLYVILAAMLWGTTGTSQALAPSGATPLAVGFLRLVIGGLTLLVFSRVRDNFHPNAQWLRVDMLLAAVCIVAYQLTFFAGVALTGVAVGTVVGIGSTPIFTGALGYFFAAETLSPRWFLSTALTISGCVLLVFASQVDAAAQVDPLGMALALGAGLSYAIFTLVNKRLIADLPSDAVMAVAFCAGAIVFAPIAYWHTVSLGWVLTVNGAAVMLHLGVLATGVAYALFGRGLQTVPVSTAGTLTLAEPLTAALLGIVLLGERLTPLSLLGMSILLVGLLVLTLRPRSRSQQTSQQTQKA